MARSLVRGLRIHGRIVSRRSWLLEGLQRYSSVPEQELVVSAAIEAKIKKAAGRKSIADRIFAAIDKIHERSVPPELRRGVAGGIVDPSRVVADIVSVAEQRIQRSMMNGDFENLSGRGRPLKFETNPHADPVEDMAYRILAKNGFAPEWVELNKEIRFLTQKWRAALASAFRKNVQANGGEMETECVSQEWKDSLTKFEVELQDINRKVLKYNLLAPFGRQVMSYKLEKELRSLLESEKTQGPLCKDPSSI